MLPVRCPECQSCSRIPGTEIRRALLVEGTLEGAGNGNMQDKFGGGSSGRCGTLTVNRLIDSERLGDGADGGQPLNLEDYFSYSYSVALSTDTVDGDEVFQAAVNGQATCTLDFSLVPTWVSITSRITAQHQTTGETVVLNPGFTVTFDEVPSKQGDTAEEAVSVPLISWDVLPAPKPAILLPAPLLPVPGLPALSSANSRSPHSRLVSGKG